MNLAAYMEEKRKKVDLFLEAHFRSVDPDRGKFSRLNEAIRYSLLGGGKRIRPILTLASFEACHSGNSAEPALGIAGALEMIHTYSLIHDDLPAMDNDDLRRGRPTVHKVYGEAMAILAGDALLSEAFLVISRSEGVPAPVLVDVMGDIAAASGGSGMAGGQFLDLESEGKKISPEELEYLHRHKTGCLIEVSVTSGAKLGGAEGGCLQAMKRYGEAIGLAFQIADDILDLEGGDAEMGKATYPSIIGLERSKNLAGELVQKAVDALREFDRKADPLREIARYIVSRRN